MAAPSDRQEPGPRARHRTSCSRVARLARSHPSPAFEPTRGRRRIQPDVWRHPGSHLHGVVARVQEHVPKRTMDLARRSKKSEMVAIGDDRPRPLRNTVHGTREPGSDGSHPARQRDAIARLDDEVRVIPLQRVVHEPKPRTFARRRERPLDLAHDRHRAKRWDVPAQAKGQVRRKDLSEVLTRRMRHSGIRTGLATGPDPTPAPTAGRSEVQRELMRAACHLDSAEYIRDAIVPQYPQ